MFTNIWNWLVCTEYWNGDLMSNGMMLFFAVFIVVLVVDGLRKNSLFF